MRVLVSTWPDVQQRQIARIGLDRLGPVASYTILSTGPNGESWRYVLPNYSRWSEPAVGLAARLLSLLPDPKALSEEDVTGYVSARVTIAGRDVEQAHAWQHGDNIVVVWRDELTRRTVRLPLRSTYRSVADWLYHALRIAAWGSDEVPPVPAPLSQVRIRRRNGRRVVALDDIPGYARAHLVRRMGLESDLGYVDEVAWRSFIGRE